MAWSIRKARKAGKDAGVGMGNNGKADHGRGRGAQTRSGTPVATSVIAALVAAALAVGVAGGFLLTRSRIPDAVVSSTDPGVLRATEGQYDDPLNVSVTMTTGAGQTIASPTAGVVTSTTCAPGATLDSGGSLIAVDGTPVLALHTAVPPYRALKPGDKGTDAAALNAELRRLGQDAPDGDAVTQATVAAFNAVAKAVGAATVTKDAGWVIPSTAAAWMERESVTVASCPAALGATVTPGEPLIVAAGVPQPAAVSIAEQPGTEGARSLQVDDRRFPLAADATRIDDRTVLDAILASGAYRQAQAMANAGMGGSSAGGTGASSLTVTLKWTLDAPIATWTVSPSSLYDVSRAQACLVSDGRPTAVRIVASELGKTMVSVDSGAALGEVRIRPDGGASCR
ncbi:peptidoglycan-binding domain 1 protein [Bifidobacterium sp. DSM 109958]|uniref:Peptidoglycan-binding domain 1 protein n=1 Tax=Bifidobacterium moraviense TaxID=2675323 RepID=A0A7Y0HYD0_9BIFI|nr:hypothetical protein [Bifidobacterium sp. DSM 109958]NMN00307.1 peptidoglycan-binding domain 1 protein [Bifidobacterium sp. DSM 109958]